MTTIPRAAKAVGALAAALTLTFTSGSIGAAEARPADRPFPERIKLPDGFLPEGITIGRNAQAYLGSRADGRIIGVDLRTGRRYRVSEGPGTASVGLKVDRLRRIFVAGGDAGTARVVDSRTGDLLRTYTLNAAPTFINDVLLTKRAVWLTDSQNAELFKLRLSPRGGLPADATTIPLGGAWVQTPGAFNANGLTTTPNRRALLVVNSSNGVLYRVDKATGRATAVDLGGYELTNGDGLLRHGRILYVVQNRLDKVAVIRLSRGGRTGEHLRSIRSDDFDVPTTVARLGRRLYLPNARFTTPPTPDTRYWITQVPARRR